MGSAASSAVVHPVSNGDISTSSGSAMANSSSTLPGCSIESTTSGASSSNTISTSRHIEAGPVGVLSAPQLHTLQPLLAAWLKSLQAQADCAQHPASCAPAQTSASSRCDATALVLASPHGCACQQHHSIYRHVITAMDAAANGPSRPQRSQARGKEDPAKVASTVGSVAQHLMTIASLVLQGQHSLEALEVTAICFEGLVNGVRTSQPATQQLQALRVSLAAAQSGWLDKLHGLLRSLAADPRLKPYTSAAKVAEAGASSSSRPDTREEAAMKVWLNMDVTRSAAAAAGPAAAANPAAGGVSSAANCTPFLQQLLPYAVVAFRWAAALQRAWPGCILAATTAGPVMATAAEAAAAVLQRAVQTRCLLPRGVPTTAGLSSRSPATQRPASEETAACIAAYQLLSQLTIELGDMLAKGIAEQQARGMRNPEWLDSLSASASSLMHGTEGMLQLCSWVLAVEGSQLVQIICLVEPQAGATTPSAAHSADNDTRAQHDTVAERSKNDARQYQSTPGVSHSTASGNHTLQPPSVSGHPGPCNSVQHAEGLLLHHADELAALLNSPLGAATSSLGSSGTQQTKGVPLPAAGSASAKQPPNAHSTGCQQEHDQLQRLMSTALHSLQHSVKKQQGALALPGWFLTAAGAASAAAASLRAAQHASAGSKRSSPAYLQLLTALGQLLKGVVLLCERQHTKFLAQGMGYWLIGSRIELPDASYAACAPSTDKDGGRPCGSSQAPGSSSGCIAGPVAAGSSAAAAGGAVVAGQHTSTKLSTRLSSIPELLLCAAGAVLTLITSNDRSTAAAASDAEVVQMSGSLLEAAELLLELPFTLTSGTSRTFGLMAGDPTAKGDSLARLWACSSRLPGSSRHTQELLLSVGDCAQQASSGMQLLQHAVRATLLLLRAANTPTLGAGPAAPQPAAARKQQCTVNFGCMSSRSDGTALLAQVCAVHRVQCSNALLMATEQRYGGGSLLAMLLSPQLRLAMQTGSKQHLQQLAFAVQVLEAATRSTLHHLRNAETVTSGTQQQQQARRQSSTSNRGNGCSKEQVSGQQLSLSSDGALLLRGLEHCVMRPVAGTAAEVFATAASAAAAACVNSTGAASGSAAAGAHKQQQQLFASTDGQMLQQALLSFALTVSKSYSVLVGRHWYNFPETGGTPGTSPLLLSNLALLGFQSQIGASQQVETHPAYHQNSGARACLGQQHTCSSSSGSSSNSSGSSGGGCVVVNNSSSSAGSEPQYSGPTHGFGSISTGSSTKSSLEVPPWQQLLCAATVLTSRMLLVEAGLVAPLAPAGKALSAPAQVKLPAEWLCGNIFRVQAAGNAAMDLLRQHACQQGFPGWEAPAAGAPPANTASPGSLLKQVQLTCILLQRWCDWISRHSEAPQAQAAQVASVQQQQQQVLVTGLQSALRVLSDQVVPALTALQQLAQQWAQKLRWDLDNLGDMFHLVSHCQLLENPGTDQGPAGPAVADAKRSGMVIALALAKVSVALQAASKALAAAVPCSYACSNGGCKNLSTVSEAFALVRGKGCVCGGCLGGVSHFGTALAGSQRLLAARYCSQQCQKTHWPQHQKLCHKLRQTATPVPATALSQAQGRVCCGAAETSSLNPGIWTDDVWSGTCGFGDCGPAVKLACICSSGSCACVSLGM